MKIRREEVEKILMKGKERRNKDEEEERGRIMHGGKERKGEE
jgi:hypothetical protein